VSRRPQAAPAHHAIPGRHPVEEALKSGRKLREVLVERLEGFEELLEAARRAKVPVRRAPAEELEAAAHGVLHQGVVGVAPPYEYVDLHQAAHGDVVVVLDGITDPQNLGAIARSAEAAGARGLVLRKRRSAHVTAAAEKAGAGAFSWLPVALVPNIVRALEELAERGFWSVGLAGEAGAELWESGLLDGKVALVIGAEGEGLSRLVAERVDELVRIPMAGRAESLNASAAAAVALFEIARRRRPVDPTR
jgi:23S rRNA (guanosine2251-2'-O)-methyltransferase